MTYTDRLFALGVQCYNHEKYIEDALQSVLAQTYENIEVIICDDCSTDRSWEIIQSFMPKLQNRFRKVKIFQNPHNLGVTPTLNKMIERMTGEVTYILSGDDMIAGDYIAEIMQAYKEHPEVSVFVSNGYRVEEKTRYSQIDCSSLTLWYKQSPDFNKETLFERLYWQNCVFAIGASIKRIVYDEFGFYDTDICIEDLEYWLRISKAKETNFFYIDKPLVFYRQNPNSLSSQEKNAGYIERNKIFLAGCEKILDKYASSVEKELYVRRKWEFLLNERMFYRRNIAKDETKILKEKLHPFIKENWHTLGWKQLVRYYHMYINALLNKM